jgi:hypothetical protein
MTSRVLEIDGSVLMKRSPLMIEKTKAIGRGVDAGASCMWEAAIAG